MAPVLTVVEIGNALHEFVSLVRHHESTLDEVNHFKVADHDTGKNITATVGRIDGLLVVDPSHAGVLQALASTRMRAHGASGQLLADLFRALMGRLDEDVGLDGLRFADWLHEGAVVTSKSSTAAGAFSDTVAAAGAAAAQHAAAGVRSAAAAAVIAAGHRCEDSRTLIYQQAEAGQPDAGAMVVYLLLRCFSEACRA